MPFEILLHWQAREYEKKEKNLRWYLVASLLLGGLILYSLFTNNPIVAVTFILIGVVGYLLLEKDPEIVNFSLSTEGVHAGNEIYPYENIRSFHIFLEPGERAHISLCTESLLLPYIHIPFEEEDIDQIRTVLLEHVPEKKHVRGLVDIMHDMF